MTTPSSTVHVGEEKHFTSSILLWMRTDQPRQTGMDHWKGPHDQRFHASPVLGFADAASRESFFTGGAATCLSPMLAAVASAIHAYDVSAALTFVSEGENLPAYRE
jgi:hypothetical protein